MMLVRQCSYVLVLWVLANCCSLGLATPGKMDCMSCGDECTMSCGTRHFRTCCFNYMRKRSDPASIAGGDGDWKSPMLNDRRILEQLLHGPLWQTAENTQRTHTSRKRAFDATGADERPKPGTNLVFTALIWGHTKGAAPAATQNYV